MLNLEQKQAIKEHAKEVSPNECCGIIVNNNVIKCENISDVPLESFLIPLDEINKYGIDNIDYYYHSHQDDAKFSLGDIIFSEILKKPCYLYTIKQDIFAEYIPNGMKIPYIGRPFFLKYIDCFTLLRDFYKNELNISLDLSSFYNRVETFAKELCSKYTWNIRMMYDSKTWLTKEFSLEYEKQGRPEFLKDFLISHGFSKVQTPQKYDVITFKWFGSPVDTHTAIYLDKSQILHHLNKYSNIEPYTGKYKRHTVHIFRHNSLI